MSETEGKKRTRTHASSKKREPPRALCRVSSRYISAARSMKGWSINHTIHTKTISTAGSKAERELLRGQLSLHVYLWYGMHREPMPAKSLIKGVSEDGRIQTCRRTFQKRTTSRKRDNCTNKLCVATIVYNRTIRQWWAKRAAACCRGKDVALVVQTIHRNGRFKTRSKILV